MNRLLKTIGRWAGLAFTASLLASCSGQGAGAGGSGDVGTTAKSALAASLVLVADSTSLDSDGRKTVTVTATTKNSDNVVLKGATVSFSTTDGGTSLTPSATTTDASGTITLAVKTTDKTTRTITITAKSESLTSTIDLQVLGTTLTINGPTGLGFNSSADYTVVIKDSGGNPVPGKAVVLTTQNTVTTPPPVTDSQGQTIFRLTGSKSGDDIVRVSALGTAATQTVTVTSRQLGFETPAALAEFLVGSSPSGNVVTLRLTDNGVPVTDTAINLVSTRGTVTNLAGAVMSSDNPDPTGRVSFRVQSPSAGIATLTATAGSIVVSQKIEFVARTPSQVTLQAGPSVVGVNLTAASSNASQLIARVTDGTNPVKGVRVNFSALADPSGGRIEPAFALTDSYGQATASFIAGAIPTGNDLVVLQAAVPTSSGPAVTPATARLTVAQQEISIRLGAANKIAIDDKNTSKYIHPHTVLVTDSAGRPISGAKVTVSVQSLRYFKGEYVQGTAAWFPQYYAICPSEDTNLNGLLDLPGEDLNGSGYLEPGNVAAAAVTSTNSLTGSDGFATIELSYPKVYSLWTEVAVTVSILAPSGTEAKQTVSTLLAVLASDVTDITTAPPGRAYAPPAQGLPGWNGSPFGRDADCSNPN